MKFSLSYCAAVLATIELAGLATAAPMSGTNSLGMYPRQIREQSGSVNGVPGTSYQSINDDQSNVEPGNAVSTGGQQSSNVSGTGGSLLQSLGARQASSNQDASANSKGADSRDVQINDGSDGKSHGGAQVSDNSSQGGNIDQNGVIGTVNKVASDIGSKMASAPAPVSGSGNSTATSAEGGAPVSGSGNTKGGAPVSGTNNKGSSGAVSGSGNSRRQFGNLFGQQGASADATGGTGVQGQKNAPIVSGFGNSQTSGGAQQADGSATGGQTDQSFFQGLGGRSAPLVGQLAGSQGASADGTGGQSAQGQHNAGVLSGAGNSLTEGGAQTAQNPGQGGSVDQSLGQFLPRAAPFLGGLVGSQGASADGTGGQSAQGQHSAGVLSGAGNSLTDGGAQSASNPGQGGSTDQSLGQFLRRQFVGGQQNSNAGAQGGLSSQPQTNKAGIQGSGNSLTQGGVQSAQGSAQGGSNQQQFGQNFPQGAGLGPVVPPGAAAGQGSAASAQGGASGQSQNNGADIQGNGNSVTQGGSQGSNQQAQGGQGIQGISQLFSRDLA